MIIVRIISGFITDNLAIEGIDVLDHRAVIEDRNPIEVLEGLSKLDMDWEIDFSKATDVELVDWTQADCIGRTVRAKVKGKTIILEGEPIGYDELTEKLADFLCEHKWFPDILADNAHSLILGIAEDE